MFVTEGNGPYRPRILLALADSAHAAQCGRYFRRHGWEVHLVADGSAFQRQAELCKPSILVVDSALIDDSARLFWDEWLGEQGSLKLVLMAPEHSSEAKMLQDSLRATVLVTHLDSVDVLAEKILGHRLAEAV